jgi:hypothetical protein
MSENDGKGPVVKMYDGLVMQIPSAIFCTKTQVPVPELLSAAAPETSIYTLHMHVYPLSDLLHFGVERSLLSQT